MRDPGALVDGPAEPPRVLDGVLLSAAALGLYLLMLQDAFINPDAYAFLAGVAGGADMSKLHPLYDPIARWMVQWLEPQVTTFRALEVVSAVGCAAAVFFFHAAMGHLESGRSRRNLAAGLCAVTPAVMFLATVIENSGLFLGFAGVAWWLTARYAASPSWSRAAWIGAATAVSSFAHATGHLLPGVAVAFLWSLLVAERERRVARMLAVLAVVFASHVVCLLFLNWIFRADAPGLGGSLEWFEGFLRHRSWSPVLLTKTWEEWLLPFFPLSVLAVVALFRRGVRSQALLFHGLVVIYVGISYVIIPGMWERGNYVLPLVFFATCLATRWARSSVLVGALVLSLATGLYLIRSHDPAASDVVVEDILALAGDDDPAILVGSMAEIDPVVTRVPDLTVIHVFQLLAGAAQGEELCSAFDQVFASVQAAGKPVYISTTGRQSLVAYGQVLNEHLLAHYRLSEVKSGSYVAYRVERKPG